MKEDVRKELNVFKVKVSQWCDSYLEFVEEENNDWLVSEVYEDIKTWLSPQMRRFEELRYITREEADLFWKEIGEIIEKFIEDINSGKFKKEEPEVDIKKLISKFNIHKSLVQEQCIKDHVTEQKIKIADIALVLIPAMQKNLCKCGEKHGKDKK